MLTVGLCLVDELGHSRVAHVCVGARGGFTRRRPGIVDGERTVEVGGRELSAYYGVDKSKTTRSRAT